jgi:thioredoxin reductase (NADPH)
MTNALLQQRREQMFPKLTAAQIARLERQGTRLQTHEGEILQELGEISRGVFVVAAGSVEALVPPSATQAESTAEWLYLLTPGDFDPPVKAGGRRNKLLITLKHIVGCQYRATHVSDSVT